MIREFLERGMIFQKKKQFMHIEPEVGLFRVPGDSKLIKTFIKKVNTGIVFVFKCVIVIIRKTSELETIEYS